MSPEEKAAADAAMARQTEIADEFEGVPGGGALRAVSRVASMLDKVTSFTSEPDPFRVNLRYCQPLER
jgi:hypothetical protein